MTDKSSKEYKAEYARKWRQANAEKHKTYQAWYHREVWYPHPANKRKQLAANRRYKATIRRSKKPTVKRSKEERRLMKWLKEHANMNEYVLEQRNLIKYAVKHGYVSPNTLKAWVNNVIVNNDRKRELMNYIDELTTNRDDGNYHGVEE